VPLLITSGISFVIFFGLRLGERVIYFYQNLDEFTPTIGLVTVIVVTVAGLISIAKFILTLFNDK